jgi:hypothetical protein
LYGGEDHPDQDDHRPPVVPRPLIAQVFTSASTKNRAGIFIVIQI